MQPTEGEIQVAFEAAAKAAYDQHAAAATARGEIMSTWEELTQHDKNFFLDAVQPGVWAALTALPDRLQVLESMLSLGPSPMQFITEVRKMLGS